MFNNKFSGLVDDLTEHFLQIKKIVDENFTAEETEEYYKELATACKGIIESDFRLKNEEDALKKTREQVGDEPTEDNIKVYMKALKAEEESNDFTEHELWSRVFGDGSREVQEVEPGTSEDVVFEQLNDSLACSVATFTPPIDPITKKAIRDPYRNQNCNHVFENRIIFEYIEKMRRKARCPFVGCVNNKLRAADILPDEGLKRKIVEYFQAHPENNSDSEDSD